MKGEKIVCQYFYVIIAFQLRVEGLDYVGVGNSTSKKDAQANAARDFVNFLVRIGKMDGKDVPAAVSFYNLFFSYSVLYS
jgi:hypothetical protein